METFRVRGELKMKSVKFLALFLIVALSWNAAWAKVIGRFAVSKGVVLLMTKKGKTKKARFGTKVKLGDTVITQKNSRAKVVMLDKNEVHISPDTKMKFENYDITNAPVQTNVIGVVYGKIRNNVKQKYDGKNKKFQVRTKAAVAGVRGTDWISSYDPPTKKAEFVTLEGQVEVGLLGPDGGITDSVYVNPGQKTSAVQGSTPKTPQNVPQNEMNQLKKEASASEDDQDGGDGQGKGEKKNEKKDKKDDGKKDGDKKDSKSADKSEKKDEGSAESKDGEKKQASKDEKSDGQKADNQKSDTQKSSNQAKSDLGEGGSKGGGPGAGPGGGDSGADKSWAKDVAGDDLGPKDDPLSGGFGPDESGAPLGKLAPELELEGPPEDLLGGFNSTDVNIEDICEVCKSEIENSTTSLLINVILSQ